MKNISLNGAWELRGRREGTQESPIVLSATVPGCVQLDLAEAGYLPRDLYMGENIRRAEEYEDYEWWYERSFEAPAERTSVFLVFEGVDCFAEYYLNGERIGKSDNMLIPYEVEVGSRLREGENTLTVHLSSAIRRAAEYDYTAKLLLGSNPSIEARHLRRPPHSFGWDIMPRAVTAGLWRGVRLEVRDPLWFSQLFFYMPRGSGTLLYTMAGDLSLKGLELEVEGSCGESRFSFRRALSFPHGRIRFGVPDPKLWYPYG